MHVMQLPSAYGERVGVKGNYVPPVCFPPLRDGNSFFFSRCIFPFCLKKFDLGLISFVRFAGRDNHVANISDVKGAPAQSERISRHLLQQLERWAGGLWHWFLSMCHQRPRSSLRLQQLVSLITFSSLGEKKKMLISGCRVWLKWKYSPVIIEQAGGSSRGF